MTLTFAGNTLVGFATHEDIKNAIYDGFDFENTMERIIEKAEDIKEQFTHFQDQQTKHGGEITSENKQVLQRELTTLSEELNRYLAKKYDVDLNNESDYRNWEKSHKPFHWYIAFYGILQDGGFDVIIGNPPYVEYSKVKKDYKVIEYETESCGNLYAFVFERSFQLLQSNGWKSMIIPCSAICTDRMFFLQELFYSFIQVGWVQTYGERPAKLFVGADQSLAIYVIQKSLKPCQEIFTSRYHKWNEKFRACLFSVLEHSNSSLRLVENSVPKISRKVEHLIFKKLSLFLPLGHHMVTRQNSTTIYYHNAARYWVRSMNFVPYFWNERDGEKISTQIKPLNFVSEVDASVVVTILNSSLYYWWYIVLSDCRHVNKREIIHFPIGLDEMTMSIKQELSQLSNDLMADLKQHAQRKETYYNATGRVVYDEFFPRHSKHIIDEIDRVLAQHYGFTNEELDFIINYDIKYRMGLGN